MDELLLRVLSESKRLSALGTQAGYESFVHLVDLREHLVEAMGDHELSGDQLERLRELQAYESILFQHMNELKTEAEEALRMIQTSKVQRRVYQAHSPVESMLFDKKS
jgi:predicted DNA-binding protein